jgi:hypothetical protein
MFKFPHFVSTSAVLLFQLLGNAKFPLDAVFVGVSNILRSTTITLSSVGLIVAGRR